MAAALTPVPSAIWRILMAVGVPVGVDEAYRRANYGFPGLGTVYVLALSFGLLGLAALTLGLVQRWGEVVPSWLPVVGGRAVPPLAAVVAGAVGSVLLTLLWISVFSNVEAIFEEYGLDGAERTVVVLSYAPMLAWGPLLGAVTVSYARRRLDGAPSPNGSVGAAPGEIERLQ